MERRRFVRTVAAGGLACLGACAGLPSGPGAEARLKELGLTLPEIKPSAGALLAPCVRTGDLLFLSGNLPIGPDGKAVLGKVGKDLDVAAAKAAARLVALRILAITRRELGSLDRVVQVVKTLGMVNCTPEFTQTPEVINGFSEVLIQVFGEKAGKGARSAVGMASLPLGAPVEVETILEVR
jgi:enamine deaminase RidA (YjgF/YER057c/UK114 family)